MRVVTMKNATKGTVLAERAEVAGTSATRRKGLLGRTGLEEGAGLWIVPCEAVHAIGMKFAIDVVFLDRGRRVRKVREGLYGWSFAGCLRAHSVVELPAGTVKRTGTGVGDRVEVEG